MAKKKNKSQIRVLEEIKNQLVLQAKRWGREDYYTPLLLEEMELDQCRKILGDLLSEKSNLEYESNIAGTDKKENEIKLSKIEMYIKKAERVIKAHERRISQTIGKIPGDMKKIKSAVDRIQEKHKVSVLISGS